MPLCKKTPKHTHKKPTKTNEKHSITSHSKNTTNNQMIFPITHQNTKTICWMWKKKQLQCQNPRRQNVTTSMVGLKNRSHMQKSYPKNIAGNAEEEDAKKKAYFCHTTASWKEVLKAEHNKEDSLFHILGDEKKNTLLFETKSTLLENEKKISLELEGWTSQMLSVTNNTTSLGNERNITRYSKRYLSRMTFCLAIMIIIMTSKGAILYVCSLCSEVTPNTHTHMATVQCEIYV